MRSISDLPEPIKTWAIDNLKECAWPDTISKSVHSAMIEDFQWSETIEGHAFWMDVENDISLSKLKKRHRSVFSMHDTFKENLLKNLKI